MVATVTTESVTNEAVVPVVSGWFSKINWAQIVQATAAILVIATGGKLNITPDQQVYLVGAIVVIGNITTVIFRQYFTRSITKQSLSPKEIITQKQTETKTVKPPGETTVATETETKTVTPPGQPTVTTTTETKKA